MDAHIQDAVAKRAGFLTGGTHDGPFHQPTVLADVTPAMKVCDEETFVHINDCTLHDEPTAPFGGVKNSGFGRENGRCGIEEMTEVKWITIQSGRREFPF